MTATEDFGVRITAALLVIAIGIAFADASVVALALPDLYGEFQTSIVGASWVLTIYALVVAVVALPVALLHRRVRPLSLLVIGVFLFTVSSVLAGLANDFSWLLVSRAGQGAGATFTLAGSLPVLGDVLGDTASARRAWSMAGAVGVAVGPALGGVLTEVFDWRAIFFVQAPMVAASLIVVVNPAVKRSQARELSAADGASMRDLITANLGFAFVFAALVAALFLGVLMAVEVWRFSPFHGALVVSALPIGMFVGRRLQGAAPLAIAIGGPVLLAVGLVGLGLLDGRQWELAVLSFALCGVGFDLIHEILDRTAVPEAGATVRASAISIGARHAGLVLGLAVIAPVLSSGIEAGTERATVGATEVLLSTDLDLAEKIPVAWDLRTAIEAAPRGEVPELEAVFEENGATNDNALGRSEHDVLHAVTAAMTRSFRPSFFIAAALAAAAMISALLIATSRHVGGSQSALIGLGIVTFSGVLLIGAMVVSGAPQAGGLNEPDPCTAEPDPFPGSGVDASIQRIALSGLNGAACELGTTRARMVLSIDPNADFGDVTWDEDTLSRALEVGLTRSIDDAEERGSIPGFVARSFRFVVANAPVGWLTARLPIFN